MRRNQSTAEKIPFWTYYICLLLMQAVPGIYPRDPSLSQAFGALKKSRINLGVKIQLWSGA